MNFSSVRAVLGTLRLACESTFFPGKMASLPKGGSFPQSPLEKPDIVCVSLYEWHGMQHRPHHTVRRLANSHRVLYVRPFYVKDWAGGVLPRWSERWEVVASNVVNFEPILFSGEDRNPTLWEANRRLLTAKLRGALQALGMDSPILWFNTPKRYRLVDDILHDQVVYDILDEYRAFSWASAAYEEYEAEMLKRANVVFAGTESIASRIRTSYPSAHFLPCGVDYAHFREAADATKPLPEDVRALGHPVLGYFGAVDERLDQDLLLGLVEREPSWQVVLIGPKLADMHRLEAHPRIHVLGLRPYEALPDYCRAFDVCLIPFVLNDVTRNINPTKLLEYFAARKPVVSIPIPDVVQYYGELVYHGLGLEAFHQNILDALKGDLTRIDAGEALAKDRSWEAFTRFIEAQLVDGIITW